MLITSISGIRGTIGGNSKENLTPIDIVSFVSAYGTWIKSKKESTTIVVGRDARVSGPMILELTTQTLVGLGIHVINLDLAPTPTVEMEVIRHNADGAIIITASHNPKEYNGLKMLNHEGEFLSATEGEEILDIARRANYSFSDVDRLGSVIFIKDHIENHIEKILDLNLVNVELVKSKHFTVVLDAINSVGGIAVPMLLEKMGVKVISLYCNPDGDFSHKPEPLEENLSDLKNMTKDSNADLGISVDPDVDRLVLVDNNGEMFGEEYTIVSISDYVLSENPGSTVSNLSSSRALSDVADKYSVPYYTSAVGEKNVVEKMKEVGAVIGGEGSGGVIYPDLHYGRDALVGIALFLSHLAKSGITSVELRKRYPDYYMAKEKIVLSDREKISIILETLKQQYSQENISTIDGLKIDFADSWVQVRASNTEPLLRIYTEAKTQLGADTLAKEFINEIGKML